MFRFFPRHGIHYKESNENDGENELILTCIWFQLECIVLFSDKRSHYVRWISILLMCQPMHNEQWMEKSENLTEEKKIWFFLVESILIE